MGSPCSLVPQRLTSAFLHGSCSQVQGQLGPDCVKLPVTIWAQVLGQMQLLLKGWLWGLFQEALSLQGPSPHPSCPAENRAPGLALCPPGGGGLSPPAPPAAGASPPFPTLETPGLPSPGVGWDPAGQEGTSVATDKLPPTRVLGFQTPPASIDLCPAGVTPGPCPGRRRSLKPQLPLALVRVWC